MDGDSTSLLVTRVFEEEPFIHDGIIIGRGVMKGSDFFPPGCESWKKWTT